MINLEILKEELNKCVNEQQVIETKNIFTKNHLVPLMNSIKTAPVESKKEIGMQVNHFKNEIDRLALEKIEQFFSKDENNSIFSNNDLYLGLCNFDSSTKHILNKTINEIQHFFNKLNFDIINGNEIVSDVNNFQRLNIPKNHPARNSHDSLFINSELLLRTHCTSNTAALINNNENEDIRILSYGNVYRKDDDDATHSHQFMQVDFVWIKKNLNVANLKWLVDSFLKYFFDSNIKTRYRLSFFPFTEPSFEVDVSCFKCNSVGCNICKNSGWIEIMGAGLLHTNVLKEANIKNKSGIAGGIGVERLVMLKYGFNNIRDLYSNILNINNQFKK